MALSRSTVVLASAIAFSVACISHEVLGHGLACLAQGGGFALLSSVYFQCTRPGIGVDLGGPAANLAVALVCMGVLRRRAFDARVRAALVFGFAFNLLWVAGCLVMSGIAARSDFAELARAFGRGEAAARLVLFVSGVALAVATCRLVAAQGCSRRTVRLAWVAAGLCSCAVALLFDGAVLPALQEAFLEGFGSLAWLLLVPAPASPAPMAATPPGRALWIAAVLALAALCVLGRGYRAAPASGGLHGRSAGPSTLRVAAPEPGR